MNEELHWEHGRNVFNKDAAPSTSSNRDFRTDELMDTSKNITYVTVHPAETPGATGGFKLVMSGNADIPRCLDTLWVDWSNAY